MNYFTKFALLVTLSSFAQALPYEQVVSAPVVAETEAVFEEQSFDFIDYINDLISANSTIAKELPSIEATSAHDIWFENINQTNSSLIVKYDTLVAWNANKMPHGHISFATGKESDFTFFNYDSNFSVKTSMGLAQFNAAELALVVKDEIYESIMEGINLDNDGFYKCSEHSDKTVTFELNGAKVLSIPLANLSWNFYESSHDLCEPMISVLDNESPVDIIFGEYVMQNLILNFQSKRLGLAPNAPAVTLV